MSEEKQGEIVLDGTSHSFPIVEGSEDEKAIDLVKFRSSTGYITLDPGYGSTGACTSNITFLDGEKGILRHRGYAIEDLANHSDFLAVAYLLINGELPTREQFLGMNKNVQSHSNLQDEIRAMINAYPDDAHPMAILSSCTTALSGLYRGVKDTDPEGFQIAIARVLAKFSSLAAFTFRRKFGKEFIEPDPELRYCDNMIHMMYGDDDSISDNLRKTMSTALNKLLIIHADHEQNCSTSTVRMIGSSGANVYASIAGGVNALWGPLHGGANQAVMEMLEAIEQDGGDVEKTLARAKDKNDPFRLMGFGHRVYKTYDPRAKIAKQACDEILAELGQKEPLIDIAIELEKAALEDEYFIKRNLYPNVDFYTGLIYRAIKIPTEMFTVMFAVGRLPGWLAHLVEMRNDPDTRINRPRQIYTGPNARAYVPVEERG